MIEVRQLTKQLPDNGEFLLQQVNLEVKHGELVAILGASGSGKSTLLKCMGLQESWTEGTLFFQGEDIFKMGIKGKLLIRKQVAFIEEKPALSPGATAHKHVLAGGRHKRSLLRRLTGTVSNEEYASAMDLLHKVGLSKKVHVPAGKLSGGETQRVAIAKALAQGAKVILADEPISGVDPQTAQAILKDMKSLCEKERLTFICTLSDVKSAEQLATRIVGLANKGIAFDITGRRLTRQEQMKIGL